MADETDTTQTSGGQSTDTQTTGGNTSGGTEPMVSTAAMKTRLDRQAKQHEKALAAGIDGAKATLLEELGIDDVEGYLSSRDSSVKEGDEVKRLSKRLDKLAGENETLKSGLADRDKRDQRNDLDRHIASAVGDVSSQAQIRSLQLELHADGRVSIDDEGEPLFHDDHGDPVHGKKFAESIGEYVAQKPHLQRSTVGKGGSDSRHPSQSNGAKKTGTGDPWRDGVQAVVDEMGGL